ncbi:cobalamin-binding protein [Alicyclobacillus macrosporangiidus]|jgi:iron complex transport system substrate-binding protein|uniref:Iron complex transport system substrate-binding protein n=1 Tax=Alicyclobacillus macrosporangiidus TaxID=392015 RepID=A0A1I7JBC6_9BACL|nr:cobalamin-binding protein [Alicyclobacillus macrosporangiidus]SFU82423.1 iron complex transport system substrate-binding protein [Alicyclobacillus macrosporangiidus]
MPARPRIVSLCPSNTELVHALGLSDCLVGVDLYSDYPPDVVKGLPRVGPDLDIDVDQVVALRPDLTLCSLSVPGMERVVRAVSAAGLPHLVFSPHSVAEIFADLRRLADGLPGAVPPGRAKAIIDGLRERIERVQEAAATVDSRPRLYWEWWPNPIFSPASGNWLTEISRLAGAENVFADHPGDQVRDDGGTVIQAQPDFLLAVWTGVVQHKVPLAKLLHRPGWQEIPAIRERRVFILAEGLYCRPSPRLIDGLEQLFMLIHPDAAARAGLPPASRHAPVRTADGRWLDGVTPEGLRTGRGRFTGG